MIRAWIRDWVKRNIIDDDPHEPEPTHGPDFDGRYYPDDEPLPTEPAECHLCAEGWAHRYGAVVSQPRLDQLEGLQPTPYGGMEDRAGFAALAKERNR